MSVKNKLQDHSKLDFKETKKTNKRVDKDNHSSIIAF
jgi:hypothetical protein